MLPFTDNAPEWFVYVELPSVLVISPFTVIPPSPLFVTIVSPVTLLTFAFLSTKIPSIPVFNISRFPPEFDTSAPVFIAIPVPVLSNFRLPPSFATLPLTVNAPDLFV